MMIAATISFKLNYLSLQDLNRIKYHFKSNNLPINKEIMYDNKIFKIIKKDKKNIGNNLNFVLLKKIGKAFLTNKYSLKNIKKIIN